MKPWQRCGYVQDSEDEDDDSVRTTSQCDQARHPARGTAHEADRSSLATIGRAEVPAKAAQRRLVEVVVTAPRKQHERERQPVEEGNAYGHDSDAVEARVAHEQYGTGLGNESRLRGEQSIADDAIGLTEHRSVELASLDFETAIHGPQDDFSSPLSSLKSTPSIATLSQERGISRQQLQEFSADDLHLGHPPQRNLRERKAIQLHPYLILDGRYQSDMRAAGLVPTRLIQPSSLHQPNHHTVSGDGGSDLDDDFVFSSPPQRNNRSQTEVNEVVQSARSIRQQQHIVSSSPASAVEIAENELPALGDLLANRNDQARLYVGRKRRKLVHQSHSSSNVHAQSHHAEHFDPRNSASPSDNPLTVAPPLSPALSIDESADLPRLTGRGGFRFPLGFSPQKPHTPATSSSGNRLSRRPVMVFDDDSSPAPQTIPPRADHGSPSTALEIIEIDEGLDKSGELTASSEDDDGSSHLRVIKRRIKGVLPASWLKLDVKAQVKGSNSLTVARSHHVLRDEEHQPGVARRRFRPTASTAPILHIAISSDEESDAPAEDAVQPQSASDRLTHPSLPSQLPHLSLVMPDDDPGEMMEDNAVDFMLTSASRTKPLKRSVERKRQTRLDAGFSYAKGKPRSTGVERLHAHKKLKKTSNTQTSIQPRIKPPRLGVLDILPSSPDGTEKVPVFLKIAQRQARRLPDQARQSSDRKHIRLQTREDTFEVHSILDDWRAGKIKRKNHPKSGMASKTKRLPLIARDANTLHQVHNRTRQAGSAEADFSHGYTHPVDYNTKISFSPTEGHTTTSSKQHGPSKRTIYAALNHIQDGQLEADQDVGHVLQDRLSFQRAMQRTDQAFTTSRSAVSPPYPCTLDQLEAHMKNRPAQASKPTTEMDQANTNPMLALRPTRQRKLKKRMAQRVDIETVSYRQPEEFQRIVRSPSPTSETLNQNYDILLDLNPWGIPYTTDFDVLPLPAGTYFHKSTFLGSGSFKKSLTMRNWSRPADYGTHTILLNGQQSCWGPWNEELSSTIKGTLAKVTSSVCFVMRSHLDSTSVADQTSLQHSIKSIETVIDANCDWLSFSDPVDRSALGLVYINELEDLQSAIEEVKVHNPQSSDQIGRRKLIQLVTRVAVLTAQVYTIVTETTDLKSRCESLIQRQTNVVMMHLTKDGVDALRTFYDENQRHIVREKGIQQSEVTVEAVVVLNHLLENLAIQGLSFWGVWNAQNIAAIATATQSGTLEYRWLSIFTILPILEVDRDGNHQSGTRFRIVTDNWDAVKTLLARMLALYPRTAQLPGTTVNEYLRALLSRCHHLIRAWAWRRCESVISLIFDFFAKREYMALRNEDKFGSPQFLEQLACSPSLDILRNEKAFHVLLKTMATGLLEMRKVYENKKIRSIVWRWIPNHSRTFHKDKDLWQEDLDALRNQHDLLSTLYWASPQNLRPRVDLVQNLVDHSSTHLEACRINIKSWSNLVTFQLNTDEPAHNVEPFVSWLKEILTQNISLHKLARTELEAQYQVAKQNDDATISNAHLETVISRNQKGVIAVLTEALAGMESAVRAANNLQAPWVLLRDSGIQMVFALFESTKKKADSVLIRALSVFDSYLDLIDRTRGSTKAQVNEDSQDYGDWPEDDDDVPVKDTANEALDFLLEQSSSVLSNVFGAESCPSEDLLIKLVQLWSRLVITLIGRKLADLETFISDYGRYSWLQLRDTEQRRKYTPYFLSCLLRYDRSILAQYSGQFLDIWLCSLVEREAHLKHQHVLTSDLLNAHTDHPLLQNLPFAPQSDGHRHEISSAQLRERRLALLSSVLSNMHDEIQRIGYHDPGSLRAVRSEYSALLKHVMLEMQRNYEDLGQGDHVTGCYVVFVQHMIEFMQQYTSDICLVDRYFTDSTAFPLPANDPTYLVGRLKSYNSKLVNAKAVKQLIMFVQTASERAAVDNEQVYLVAQLTAALDGSFSQERSDKHSLRSVFWQVVFPAYTQVALDGSSAWILSRPMLTVCCSIFKGLLHKFSTTSVASVRAVNTTLMAILASAVKAIAPLEFSPVLLQEPRILAVLSLIFNAVALCLPTLDYVQRRNRVGAIAANSVRYLRDFSLYAGKVLLGQPDAFPPTNLTGDHVTDASTSEMTRFCLQKLEDSLQDKWKTEHGAYFVKRASTWKEVHVSMGSIEEERQILIRQIETFHAVLSRSRSL